MSLLRRIERALASREGRASAVEVAEAQASGAGGEVVFGTGAREAVGGAGVGAEGAAKARGGEEAVGVGGAGGGGMALGTGRAVEPGGARTAAERWIDPRVSGVYVLWSHRPKPAVRGAKTRGAPVQQAAMNVGGFGHVDRDMSRGVDVAVGGTAVAVAMEARAGSEGVEVGSRGVVARGFVREVTRWPLAGARPPLLAGRAFVLPGAEAWRAARPWLVAHGREDMLEGSLFLDVEATGLGHAAGTVAFVVGLARVAGACVEVEQWTLSRLSAEAAMLAEIAGRIAGGPLVTFNGASFDLPLLRGRLRRCGLDPAALAGPHLDLLPIARRLWRGRAPDCRLATLERVELGAHRVGDIPGHAIPAVFWEVLQRPDCPQARAALGKVCAHNVVDILAMPALARAMAATLTAPTDLDLALRTAEHLTALGRRPAALAAIEPWIEPLIAGPVAVDAVAALREGRALRLAASLLRREGLRERAAVVREAARRRAAEPNAGRGAAVRADARGPVS